MLGCKNKTEFKSCFCYSPQDAEFCVKPIEEEEAQGTGPALALIPMQLMGAGRTRSQGVTGLSSQAEMSPAEHNCLRRNVLLNQAKLLFLQLYFTWNIQFKMKVFLLKLFLKNF